jgi:hypothetical protein
VFPSGTGLASSAGVVSLGVGAASGTLVFSPVVEVCNAAVGSGLAWLFTLALCLTSRSGGAICPLSQNKGSKDSVKLLPSALTAPVM